MGYESLSTIIVLVIALMGIVVWLPERTRKGMKSAQEHRADKYSTSLHLVDERSGTRFSDGDTRMEGIMMQSNKGQISAQRVAEVRRLRREAIRRRRVIVLSLAAITALVLVCAFALRFSPWFALIPAALLGVVLALGVHAAAQAREWERKVALAAKRSAAAGVLPTAKSPVIERDKQPIAGREGNAVAARSDEEAATQVMEQREIRSALRKSKIEKRKAFERRGKIAAAEQSSAVDSQSDVQSSALAASHEQDASHEQSASHASSASSMQSESPATAASSVSSASHVSSVSPATLDAIKEANKEFPAIASSEPELISFSLGSSDSEAATAESLEIKSTRQVAKAEPVDTIEREMLSAEAKVETKPAGLADVEAFHLTERQAEVDAPESSSDSLGIGVEAILTRRKA